MGSVSSGRTWSIWTLRKAAPRPSRGCPGWQLAGSALLWPCRAAALAFLWRKRSLPSCFPWRTHWPLVL